MDIINDDDITESMHHLEELLVHITGSTSNRYLQLDGCVDAEGVGKWFRQLNQDVKITASDLNYQLKGHKFIVPQFFKLLHECFLGQHWTEAVQILRSLAYEPKGTSQTIWKAGMEVMYQSPEDHSAIISRLFRQLKLFKDLHAQDVVLEYTMYLLSLGRITEASTIVKQKDHKKAGFLKTVTTPAHRPAVYSAYKGLVWYMEWLLLKQNIPQTTDLDKTWQQSSQADYEAKKVENYAQQAIALMETICGEPGVWDIFIHKLVQLKEEYEGVDSARSVLTRYQEMNSDNPNSHRYLYEFLIKHGASDEEKIDVLKVLADKDPSNPLVLDLCKLLKNSPSTGHYLFALLDYCKWREQTKAWKTLRKYLRDVHQSKLTSNVAVVGACWEERSSWWPAYHFTASGQMSSMTTPSLEVEKAVCAAILMGKENQFTIHCEETFDEAHREKLASMLRGLDVT